MVILTGERDQTLLATFLSSTSSSSVVLPVFFFFSDEDAMLSYLSFLMSINYYPPRDAFAADSSSGIRGTAENSTRTQGVLSLLGYRTQTREANMAAHEEVGSTYVIKSLKSLRTNMGTLLQMNIYIYEQTVIDNLFNLCSVKYDNREVAFEARFVVKTLDRKSRLFRPPAALTRVNRAEDEAAGLLRDGDRRVCPTRVYSCFVAGQQTHGRDRAAHVARHRGDDDHHHRTGTRRRCGGLEKEKGKKEKWER